MRDAGASHAHMISQLTGPLEAGAVDTAIAISAAGRLDIPGDLREPLLLLAPVDSLETKTLRVSALLDPDGEAKPLGPLRFGPYTESGSYLPLYRPPVDPTTERAAGFSVALSAEWIDATSSSAAPDPIAPGDLEDLLSATLLEGRMGRMLYLLAAEKARIRRAAREIGAMRSLDRAWLHALDRHGAGLGVARFSDELVYDSASGEIVTPTLTNAEGVQIGEPDDSYRRRLELYRPFLLATYGRELELLNGAGDSGDPNRGALGQMGLHERFSVDEEDNRFAVAIHLVESGSPDRRSHFLDFVRATYLLWPAATSAADAVHAARPLPSEESQRISDLRTSLRGAFTFRDDAAIAPMLASALDRAGRCREALGVTASWRVFRTQDSAGGSRYELGLGADIAPPTSTQLDRLVAALADPGRHPAPDPDVEAILQSMTPTADDPHGAWFFQACGLQTVHPVIVSGRPRLYVSHLPTFGLAITGPSAAGPESPVPLEAHYHAPEDPGENAVLLAGIGEARTRWSGAGHSDFVVLDRSGSENAWAHATVITQAQQVFRAAGLPTTDAPGSLAERLGRLPAELLSTLALPTDLATQIRSGTASSADDLKELAGFLEDAGLASLLPIATDDGRVVLVVAVLGLPVAGANLTSRRSTGFRWYTVPIDGTEGRIGSVGSRTVYQPVGPGLIAVVVVGYARRGRTDPYEYRVGLPDGVALSLEQYEFLMNLLDHAHPLGVEVNTFSIRQHHVDLDGDGSPEPLTPDISRTYRQFRRQRSRGEIGVTLDDL